jgi:osmoprotectant transport system ATP-binding protein
VLAQYDTPDAVLAHPADAFVAQFVGEDRALRRLALRRLSDVPLAPVDARNSLPRLDRDTTVRNAVSVMLESRSDEVVVVDGDKVLGTFRLRDAGALL